MILWIEQWVGYRFADFYDFVERRLIVLWTTEENESATEVKESESETEGSTTAENEKNRAQLSQVSVSGCVRGKSKRFVHLKQPNEVKCSQTSTWMNQLIR